MRTITIYERYNFEYNIYVFSAETFESVIFMPQEEEDIYFCKIKFKGFEEPICGFVDMPTPIRLNDFIEGGDADLLGIPRQIILWEKSLLLEHHDKINKQLQEDMRL